MQSYTKPGLEDCILNIRVDEYVQYAHTQSEQRDLLTPSLSPSLDKQFPVLIQYFFFFHDPLLLLGSVLE